MLARSWIGLAASLAGLAAITCTSFGPVTSLPGDVSDASPEGSAEGDAKAGCGGEPDFSTHPQHCGRCNHDCLGGACLAGRCQPYALATNLKQPRELAVDGDSIYVSNPSGSPGIVRVSKADGTTQPVTQLDAGALALDATSLYFCDAADSKVWSITKDGGSPTKIADDRCLNCALRDDQLFCTRYNDGIITRYVAGAAPVNVFTVPDSGPEYLALDDTKVFVTEHDGNSISVTQRHGLGSASPLAAAVEPRRIAIDATHVYWNSYPTGAIRRVAKTGGVASTVSTIARNARTGGLTLDDVYVYWMVGTSNGALARAPKDGTIAKPEILVDGLQDPQDVIADGSVLYFLDGSSLMRLAKP